MYTISYRHTRNLVRKYPQGPAGVAPACVREHSYFSPLSLTLALGPVYFSPGGDLVLRPCVPLVTPTEKNMASIPRPMRSSSKNSMGGGSRGGGFSRDSPRGGNSANGSTPRGSSGGTGAWGTGRLDRSSPVFSASKQQQGSSGGGGDQQQQQHPAGASGSSSYKMACRDRWMNVTKTMMGERAEITTTSGCVYEGVFHVLTPGDDPRPGGKRGMYRVRLFPLVCVCECLVFTCPGRRGSLKPAHILFWINNTTPGCPLYFRKEPAACVSL